MQSQLSDIELARICRGAQLEALRDILRRHPFRPRPKHVESLMRAYYRGAFPYGFSREVYSTLTVGQQLQAIEQHERDARIWRAAHAAFAKQLLAAFGPDDTMPAKVGLLGLSWQMEALR